MDGFPWLAFAGGAVAGLFLAALFAWLVGMAPALVLPQPRLGNATCTAGQVTVPGSVAAAADGLTLAQLYVYVYTDANTVLTNVPPSGSVPISPPTFPITVPAVGSSGYVAVWAAYQGCCAPVSTPYTCSGSGSASGMMGMSRSLSATVTEQFEAVPRAYRVSPGSPLAEGGPAADLVGALSRTPEALLVYTPEASTPVEPVWQARGGPEPVVRWSLNLLHRAGGLGAVLSAVSVVGGREVRFTWVTSDWRFHTANRLAPEASEPGVPALLVRPA